MLESCLSKMFINPRNDQKTVNKINNKLIPEIEKSPIK